MSKSILHVVPHDNNWAVKREGNERASSTHPTQKEAIDAARELARELDDIVIHRPDGTIRERVTYFGATGNGETKPDATPARSETDAVRPEDVTGVGARVSWEAVVAGAFVALAAYVALSLLALACGLSLSDQIWGRNFVLTSVVVSGVILILSLLLGGYVASATTAGEQPREAGIYGVLVWGVVFVVLLTGGLGFGLGHLSGLRQLGPTATPSAERVSQELGLTAQQQQHYAELVRDTRGPVIGSNPARAAWWAFGFVVLSLLSAIVGGWLGSGPGLVLRRVDERTVVPAPRPA